MRILAVGLLCVVFVCGIVVLIAALIPAFNQKAPDGNLVFLAAVLIIAPFVTVVGSPFRKVLFPGGSAIEFQEGPGLLGDTVGPPPPIQPRELAPEVKAEREAYAEAKSVPGADAPEFDVLADTASLELIPTADPMVPMYALDRNYRILDWNEAFAIAFDRTMEGRRGMSVLEWVYFLDNYEQVLDHGEKVFANSQKLPVIDVEELKYTSDRYGPIEVLKRAYQIPADDGACAGWLVILAPTFSDQEQTNRFHLDLIHDLREGLVWSEYSISYDAVLDRTDVYPDLLEQLIGENGGPPPIPPNTRIADLGAGTGSLAARLATPSAGRIVFALDNSRVMLDLLRARCKPYLRRDDEGPGVIALKQDITSLFGLKDDYFDYALMNNVLVYLEDSEACLMEVYRVLKPGGEVRISGPKKDTSLDILFQRIRADLERKGEFEKLKSHYERVEYINRTHLAPELYKWVVADVEAMLREAGFAEITYSTDQAYAGQAMIVCARK